ncbi:MAG TPA: hypothetical protein VIM22_08770 [Solirubrobacteraceae bacterium]
MPRATAPVLMLAILALAGCGRAHHRPPSACTTGVTAIQQALQGAPGRVALADGTLLSTCVGEARSDGDIQTIGAIYTGAADRLARAAGGDDSAALRLGYLIGATRRAASRTSGIHLELVRRLEQTVGVDGVPPAHRAAFRRGIAAGRRDG